MVADKVRGYFYHKAADLVTVSFKGDWVMHESGFLVQTSTVSWEVAKEELLTRAESLEEKLTNIVTFCNKDSLLGIRAAKDDSVLLLRIVHWFETEFEARTIADARNQNKIWDCKLKKYV